MPPWTRSRTCGRCPDVTTPRWSQVIPWPPRRSRPAGCRSSTAPTTPRAEGAGRLALLVLVGGLAGIDLVDPGDDAAADVDGVGEAGALGDGEDLGGADAGLAVEDQLLV